MENIKKIVRKIKNLFQEKEYLKIILLFTFLFVVSSWMYFSTERFWANDDHFFHIRFAEIFRENGLNAFYNFKWLYFSNITQGDFFVYYNFLFYIFLIPFTFVTPLFIGIKLAGVTLFSGVISLLYYGLLKLKIKFPLLWVLIFLSIVNDGSIGRLLNARPFILSPILLVLLLVLIYRKKYWAGAILSFFYFFWHGATFFFPIIMAITYFLFNNLYTRKFNWKIILGPAMGVAVAFGSTLIFFPGFDKYFGNIIGIYWETILGKQANLNEGNELYPFEALNFIRNQLWFSSLFILATVFEIYQYVHLKIKKINLIENNFYNSKEQRLKAAFFFLSLFFFLGCFAISKRYNDYFVFFGLTYLALSFNVWIKFIEIKSQVFKRALIVGMIVLFFYLFGSNILAVRSMAIATDSYDQLEESSNWIKENVPAGEVIFHPTWNWFTLLFYYNSNSYYLAGLEPRYMYEYNPKLYWAWRNISEKGILCFQESCQDIIQERRLIFSGKNEDKKKMWYNKEGKKIADFLENSLKTNYIVTSTTYFRLNEIMDNYSKFEKVFTGTRYPNFFVYKIKNNN